MSPTVPARPFVHALRDAWRGVARTTREERSFRWQLVATTVAVGASLWLGSGTAVVALCCGVVLAAELLNTALERLADALHPDPHPAVGAAKDAAAGAVVMSAAAAIVVGLVTLLPALWHRLAGWWS